jgi:two-component system cell cycle sensor histidine kinase/response regulator CckA
MADLTSQLLAYARGGKYNAILMSLGHVVQETLPLVEHTLNPGVRVETDLPQRLWDVKADPTQMQMVASAVIANANEAMEGPGRIRISVGNVELDQAFTADYPGIDTGPYVRLCIEDNGRGMNEETKKRMFEPFFTTHFLGRGLGMPAAYGIVANHNGIITVDSALGKGTRVCVYLPAAIPKSRVSDKARSERVGLHNGRDSS